MKNALVRGSYFYLAGKKWYLVLTEKALQEFRAALLLSWPLRNMATHSQFLWNKLKQPNNNHSNEKLEIQLC